MQSRNTVVAHGCSTEQFTPKPRCRGEEHQDPKPRQGGMFIEMSNPHILRHSQAPGYFYKHPTPDGVLRFRRTSKTIVSRSSFEILVAPCATPLSRCDASCNFSTKAIPHLTALSLAV